MNYPKMILFDYGQTLMSEHGFDGIKGTHAVLQNATKNPNNILAEEVMELEQEVNNDIGRYNENTLETYFCEVHNYPFQNYLYEYFGIEFEITPNQLEKIFWDVAAPAAPTENINEFLEYLNNKNIRTGVISNISFSGKALSDRLNEYLPNNKFEFILASSEYIFRKPHKRIFELALRKAGLNSSDVWYCGDNAVCDIDGASACGISPVWYKGALMNSHIPKSDHIAVENWNELINVLEQLEK